MRVLDDKCHKLVVPQIFKPKDIFEAMNTDIPRALFVIRNRNAFLLHLYVPLYLRHHGIARRMLFEVSRECLRNNCEKIYVDDMSDRFRKDDNIYIRFGFVYKNICDSEMYVNIKKLMENIEEYELNNINT